jgi:hypothetical protein
VDGSSCVRVERCFAGALSSALRSRPGWLPDREALDRKRRVSFRRKGQDSLASSSASRAAIVQPVRAAFPFGSLREPMRTHWCNPACSQISTQLCNWQPVIF